LSPSRSGQCYFDHRSLPCRNPRLNLTSARRRSPRSRLWPDLRPGRRLERGSWPGSAFPSPRDRLCRVR